MTGFEKSPLVEKVMAVLQESKQFNSHQLAAIYGALYFALEDCNSETLKKAIGTRFYAEFIV